MSKSKNIILGVTGSIAAYKAGEIINRLKEKKLALTVVMTKEAKQFITPLTLETLSANKVIDDLFSLDDNLNPVHISLAKKADLILIAPASANIIAKLAAGICDDVLSCLALSASAPIVLCPAMNERMFKHKITQENIARLKRIGYHFIGPQKGRLVCDEKGMGHLADVKEIVQGVKKLLAKKVS